MVELRPAAPEELAEAEALWTAVFASDGEAQRRFYAACGLSGPVVLKEDGMIRGLLALPEVKLTFPDGWSVRGREICALCVHPDYRGQGYGGYMLNYTAEILKESFVDFLAAVPRDFSLWGFFARQGFVPGFYRRRLRPAPCEGRAQAVDSEGYAALRESLLSGTTHAERSAGQFSLSEGLYRLELSHGEGCAAVRRGAVEELLCRAEDEAEGCAAAAALCPGGMVNLPGTAENGVPFGAIRWLQAVPPPRWRTKPAGYLGFSPD